MLQKDRVLLEGIGSLHEITSLCLTDGSDLTAQELSTFLHRPSMIAIVLLNRSERLKGIAKRWDELTYLHG